MFQHGKSNEPTKFVTLNFKLEEAFNQENISEQLEEIEDFYIDIDNCNNSQHSGWNKDKTFQNLFHKENDSISVSIVSKEYLENSIAEKENWDTYFISPNLFQKFDENVIQIYPRIIKVMRGQRTGWNNMFVIPTDKVYKTGIEQEFLIPYLKSSSELEKIEFTGNYDYYLFVCTKDFLDLEANYPGAYNWICKFENALNKNGKKTIKEANAGNKPYWYSQRPKKNHIITSINPYERYFFSFSSTPFIIDQRLVAITVNDEKEVELIAALLNSVVTFLTMEMRGTSRNLGALDLNANYFKALRILNPNKLSNQAKKQILAAFQPLKKREIETFSKEIRKADRINFDKVVLKSFGIDETVLNSLYQILSSVINDRVTMKER